MITLKLLEKTYSICKLSPNKEIPNIPSDFLSITRTKDELSIVLEAGLEPIDSKVEKSWKVIQVIGPLDFSLTGVLSSIANPLSEANISIFVISTFDTDFILIKKEKINEAIDVLRNSGFSV